ncbi:MAG: hypothetical protein R3E08_14170 [Thiotrichaceae bacterium]
MDGKITTTLPNADIYFINPSGIIFGEHASLSVPQSFYLSTADVLRLGTTGQLNARQPEASLLTTAAPSAFGFLSDSPSPITIQSRVLAMQTGKSLHLIGGDIRLENTTLFASDGRINLLSVAQAGEIDLNQTALTPQNITHFGTITLSHAENIPHLAINSKIQLANLDVSGQQGGKIWIRSGQLVIEGGEMFADSYGGNGQGIEIITEQQGKLHHARVTAENLGSGLGGGLTLQVPQLQLDNSTLLTSARAAGNAGKVNIQTTQLDMQQSLVGSYSYNAGHSGYIQINAANALNLQQSSVSTNAQSNSHGNAAGIEIDTPILTLQQQSLISSLARGSGSSGDIHIKSEDIQLTDSSGISNSAQATSTQAAGNLNIETARLKLQRNGTIDSTHRGNAHGGKITITATDFVQLNQRNSDNQPSAITSNAYNSADGGQISIDTPSLNLSDGAVIQTATLADSMGNAGNITVKTDLLTLDSQAGIIANSGGTGQGGIINLTARQLKLHQAGISSNALNAGASGALQLHANTLQLFDNSEIQSVAAADGNAGRIAITATDLFLTHRSKITAGTRNWNGRRDLN